ncbi:hypothetical protein L2I57_010015 [Tychonema sp. BBK16]
MILQLISLKVCKKKEEGRRKKEEGRRKKEEDPSTSLRERAVP